MNRSTPGLPVHHQLPEFTQTHVHRVGDAIQPSHPRSSPSPPAPQSLPASGSFLMSQLFAWGGQSTGVSASASVLPVNTQDWFPLGYTGWISFVLMRDKSEITCYIVFDSIYWKTRTYRTIHDCKGIYLYIWEGVPTVSSSKRRYQRNLVFIRHSYIF